MALADAYSDPTILAFLRASGLADETAAADVARKQASIQQALGTSTEDLNAQGEIARRGIAGGMEANGMLRSGQNLRLQAEQEAAQARQQTAMQNQAATQLGDLQGSLATQIANNQQKAAEMGLAASQDFDKEYGKAKIDATDYSASAGYGTPTGPAPYQPPAAPAAPKPVQQSRIGGGAGKYKAAF